MCNMKALSLLVRKLWRRLKFLFTYTHADAGNQGYDISSPDIRSGLLKMSQPIRGKGGGGIYDFLFALETQTW